MKRFFTLLLAFLLLQTAAGAAVQLPSIFSDGMVLQRNAKVRIWGRADAGEKLVLVPSWNPQEITCKAGRDGRWSAQVQTPEAGGPYSLTILAGKEKLMISDILSGEVWMCSGQSNMAMKLMGNQKAGQQVDGALEAVIGSAAYADKIRFFSMDLEQKAEGCEDVPNGRWEKAGPDRTAHFSAVAYFFARQLTDILGVPVAIISNSWGGSKIELWTDNEILAEIKAPDKPRDCFKGRKSIYNSMLKPLAGYGLKGVLWYQGESNKDEVELYEQLFPAMVSNFRKLWGREDIPFYTAQIAPFNYPKSDPVAVPQFVEAQVRLAHSVPYCGIIGTTDIGDPAIIHPAEKETVGQRFAYLALQDCYRWWTSDELDVHCPEVVAVVRKGNEVVVTFDQPLMRCAEGMQGLEIAGEDGVWKKTTARFETGWKSFRIADKDQQIRAVRYAYGNWLPSNLKSIWQLPAFPFCRTVE